LCTATRNTLTKKFVDAQHLVVPDYHSKEEPWAG
jgi:hypothetical protein